MIKKPFTHIAVGIFILVGILHVLRLIYGWEVTIASIVIPMWISVAAFIVTGILAVLVLLEVRN